MSGNNPASTSSVSKPPFTLPASRNFRNGASTGSPTVHLRLGQHFSSLFLDPPHVTDFHLELLDGELLELSVQFQLAAQLQRRRQRHLIKVRVSLREIQQHVTEVFAQSGVA